MLQKNVDGIDKGMRFLIGSILVMSMSMLYFGFPQDWQYLGVFAYILYIAGPILMLTAFIGFCPLYIPFGFSTCRRK